MTYAEKLTDPRWIVRRNQIRDIHNNVCCECSRPDIDRQHVHHKKYLPGREPWDYPDCLLELLCDRCHTVKTIAQRREREKREGSTTHHLLTKECPV